MQMLGLNEWTNFRDIIRSEYITKILRVTYIEEKIKYNRLRWFEHVQ